jgi:adenylate kinase
MRLLIMGPPGAGKGTQAAMICAEFGITHISTGDLFRLNLAQGTALGQEAKKYMDAGEYVPDSVTNGMVRSRLEDADVAAGFLLDGYPRTVAQVAELDGMLGAAPLDRVLELTADTEEVVKRLLARASEQGRADDTAEVIRRRLELYAEQTEPLTALYKTRGLLVQVDGLGSVAEVTARISDALKS